jgi:hypothetical protein
VAWRSFQRRGGTSLLWVAALCPAVAAPRCQTRGPWGGIGLRRLQVHREPVPGRGQPNSTQWLILVHVRPHSITCLARQVGGKKFDLRLYALVTSFAPLTVWLYRGGFARFSNHRFSMRKEVTATVIVVSPPSCSRTPVCTGHVQGPVVCSWI